jgi:hypothetical protein
MFTDIIAPAVGVLRWVAGAPLCNTDLLIMNCAIVRI